MMIYKEEQLFKDSFAAAIGLVKPPPPLQEDFQIPEEFALACKSSTYDLEEFTVNQKIASVLALDTGEMPDGITGLIPDGSNKVNWRWEGRSL